MKVHENNIITTNNPRYNNLINLHQIIPQQTDGFIQMDSGTEIIAIEIDTSDAKSLALLSGIQEGTHMIEGQTSETLAVINEQGCAKQADNILFCQSQQQTPLIQGTTQPESITQR